ncbi:protein adenylyltransferase SelO [Limimaricola hongkongensis]|uniref:Protein nucleotidyltransferase YdiU n=1 Tax=Limimaricola hongkongensis DSM 17492 TaxID=1122180 RepID=A0A017HJ12_9RHOB|nr:YdiU family protein [Limimaricola hongkongensis]EYD73774.1 Selenoprotein [Limimaricola hongkongensis DSM 17492]
MSLHIPFDNSYARLPDRLFTRQAPVPVASPGWIALNDRLARDLDLDAQALRSDEGLRVFAGNAVPDGAAPLAQLYAGHQFGQWNPQLGDGRAILLGEILGPDGIRRDIALKGSGRTPYSRMGDGRAWLGPVIREYIMSEAMHALGVPTTRALAAVTTGEEVIRETVLPGAVLTRVAQSHIRVGTFQILTARGDHDGLRALADHTMARHYPDAGSVPEMLAQMVARQADLIARWMSLGFIHGVMNTDNCSVAGETIDYGPCAFMDGYHPGRVFSSIDAHGRYAYGNQPQVALWNIAQFATALVPLMPNQDRAVEDFTAIINRFADLYQSAWLDRFGAKIGLAEPTPEDRALIEALLTAMSAAGTDFTNGFRALAEDAPERSGADADWIARWRARGPDLSVAAAANPVVVPRLHRIEATITAAMAGDLSVFDDMLTVVTAPFEPDPALAKIHVAPPAGHEKVDKTFCGT